MNLAQNLVDSATARGGHVAIKLDDSTLTYTQLDALSQRAAGLLQEYGVQPGDRVGLMLPNVPHFAVLYYAALRLGAVVVPMNPLLKEREVAYYLSDSGARVILVWNDFAEEAELGAKHAEATAVRVGPEFLAALGGSSRVAGVIDREAADTAVILYTSGTTGQPKGAELTHANLAANVDLTVETLLRASGDDVIFGGLPLFHVFGQTCGLNVAVKIGATLTLVPRFDAAKALEVIARDGVTIFEGVPTMFTALLAHPERERFDVSALRVCVTGGSAMPVEVLHGFEAAFGCAVLEGYGLSETSPVASFNHPDTDRKPGSIGTPVRGVALRLVAENGTDVAEGEVGEIWIRGHNVMKGYWGKPDATAAAIKDGWFATGDLARKDEDGFYFIVDRKKDLIIRGGYNVYPREVEEVLYEHPAVLEAAVIGVPRSELGEEIAAVVALRPGAAASSDELQEYVKARVAAYKYPRSVTVVDALPKGPTGKILKREIRVTA